MALGAELESDGLPKPFDVTITRIRVHTNPELDIFRVVVTNRTGEWPETFGSAHEVEIFLKGLKVGARMLDNYHLGEIEIPREPSAIAQVIPMVTIEKGA